MACIIGAENKDFSLHRDSYSGLTDPELETLLQQSREAVISLEAELKNRQIISHPPSAIKECGEKLRKTAGDISTLGRLDARAAKHTMSAAGNMTTVQTTHNSKVYQAFLFDILRHCGPPLVLLCAASLGKQRVVDLHGQNRTALVHYVKANRAILVCPALVLLAKEYRIPSENSLKPGVLAQGLDKGQQESSDEESDQAESETITKQDSSPLKPHKRRHIENTQALETMQTEELAETKIQRRAATQRLLKRQKEIEYRCSEAPVSQMWLLGERFFEAVQSSHQWKWERDLGGSTTDCLNALIPKNRSQDITITLVVGHQKGQELIEKFKLLFL